MKKLLIPLLILTQTGTALGTELVKSFSCTQGSDLKNLTRFMISNFQTAQNHSDVKKSDAYRRMAEDCWQFIAEQVDAMMLIPNSVPRQYKEYLSWLSQVGKSSAAAPSIALLGMELQKSWESKFLLPMYVRTKPNFNDAANSKLQENEEIKARLDVIQTLIMHSANLASMTRALSPTLTNIFSFKSALLVLGPYRASVNAQYGMERILTGESPSKTANRVLPSLAIMPPAPAEIMTLAFPYADPRIDAVLKRDSERRFLSDFVSYSAEGLTFAAGYKLTDAALMSVSTRYPVLRSLVAFTTAAVTANQVRDWASKQFSPESIQKMDVARLKENTIKASNALLEVPAGPQNTAKSLIIAKYLVDLALKLDAERNLKVYEQLRDGNSIKQRKLSPESVGQLARFAINEEIRGIKCESTDDEKCAAQILGTLRQNLNSEWQNEALQLKAISYLTGMTGSTASEKYRSLGDAIDRDEEEYLKQTLASTGYTDASPTVKKLSADTDLLIGQLVAVFYKADRDNRDAMNAAVGLPALPSSKNFEIERYKKSKVSLKELAKSVLMDRLLHSTPFYLGISV